MAYIILVAGLILDRITKIWAVNTLKGNEGITVIEGFFDLSYLENRGAAWGIFQGKTTMLAILTGIIIIGIIVNFYRTKNKSLLFTLSNAFIVTGAVGNLIDRVREGFVVDFLEFHYGTRYYFPTFNVADMFVTVGTVFLIIYILKEVE
ncbi:MAG TPA: signal peptidase II [Clostridiaceae bacterium]|nr:signal peptidase II [Clostridiaceae bacterium]